MKKFILFAFLFSNLCFAQDVFQINISKPYCVFNFLETSVNKTQGTSSTLHEYIQKELATNQEFQDILTEFKSIQTDYPILRSDYPSTRRQTRSTRDLIIIALVNSKTIDEFRMKSIGLLPNTEQIKLVNTLTNAEKFYDKIIWEKSEKDLIRLKNELGKYSTQASDLFKKFRNFYHSNWSDDMPFIVSLYPIPGERGTTTATPHSNSLCVGVLTKETDYEQRMGVVLHEACHVLYDEQSIQFQYQLEEWFTKSNSRYSKFASAFFDEAMATAIGNGWATKILAGKLDTTEWYSNEYINGYAKGLFPLVEAYMQKNQSLDSVFVNKAITIFEQLFPHSISDYGILLNNMSFYSDSETSEERNYVTNAIGKVFQLSRYNFSCPVTDPISLGMIKEEPGTQFIILDAKHSKSTTAIKTVFPELKKINFSKMKQSTLLSFYDSNQRPIIILYLLEIKELENMVAKMQTMKSFNLKSIVQ